MTVQPPVSVVVVTWNSDRTIAWCLESVSREREGWPDLELVVVDNGSTDSTRATVRKFPGVRLLAQPENVGFCRGNNLGIAACGGRYVLLLNPDAAIGPGFIPAAVAAMEANPSAALLTGKVLRATPDGVPARSRGGHLVIDTVGIRMARNRQAADIGHDEEDRDQFARGGEVFAVSGAVCFARAAALAALAVDGEIFDEAFFAYKEDVDLGWRARLQGWTCVYVPEALAWHVGGWRSPDTSRAAVPRATRFYSFRNRRLLLLKNERLRTALPDLPAIVWFELLALAYAVVREPFLLPAYAQVLRLWPRLRRWRRAVQSDPGGRRPSPRALRAAFASPALGA